MLGLDDGEPLLISASAADAARLAADLARLIDDLEVTPGAWSRLEKLVPEDHARYFQITLEFLKIISHAWPAYLQDKNRVDPVQRRDRLIRLTAKRLSERGSSGPVVAASKPITKQPEMFTATVPQGKVSPTMRAKALETKKRVTDPSAPPSAIHR